MNNSNVCLVKYPSKNERIMVSADSVETLKRLLGRLEGETWVLESEIKEPEAPAARAVETADGSHLKAFRVILISGSSSFRTGLVDLNFEGMTLKCQAPHNFNQKSCVAYISHHQMTENLEVTCEVHSEDGVSYVNFVNAKACDLEKLSAWMSEVAV